VIAGEVVSPLKRSKLALFDVFDVTKALSFQALLTSHGSFEIPRRNRGVA